jgi:hypothetical protein
VVILSRNDGITTYTIQESKENVPIACRIDTHNEHLLLGSIFLSTKVVDGKTYHRVVSSHMALARIVAEKNPSPHADRIIVDHRNRMTTDDTEANLHWETPAFNTFNMDRKDSKSGFRGVQRAGRKYVVAFRGRERARFDEAEPAARLYDLLCRLQHGDQLDGLDGLLNSLPDQDKEVEKTESYLDGVAIWRVCSSFLVLHDEVEVASQHQTLTAARQAASSTASEVQARRFREEAGRAQRRSQLTIERNASQIAYFPLVNSRGEPVEALVDDSSWLDIRAAGIRVFITRADRVAVSGGGVPFTTFLSRWLRSATAAQVVDHVDGDIYNHRLKNLRATDRSANAQNARKDASRSGLIGVSQTHRQRWRVETNVKGQHRSAAQNFEAHEMELAIEMYDLVSLYQHGAGALLNRPHRLEVYLADLEDTETIKRVVQFLAPKAKVQYSDFAGVSVNRAKVKGKFYSYWNAQVRPTVPEGEKMKLKTKRFGVMEDKAGEVKAAIFYDLWRLKLKGVNYTINFEHMRPWYLYHLPTLSDDNDLRIIEKAYQRLGGDAWALAQAKK